VAVNTVVKTKYHTPINRTVIELESYTLDGTREIECEECDTVGEITAIAKSGNVFNGVQVGKEASESGWVPTRTGWECPSCAD
jgi:hypothetical protein